MKRRFQKLLGTIIVVLIMTSCAGMGKDGGLKIENGMAMPMIDYSPVDTDNRESSIFRFCVYVETDHDTDGDGMADLVKAFIQLPKSAAEGRYQAAAIYDPYPYAAGIVTNMEALLDSPFGAESFDKTKLYREGEKRESQGSIDTMAAALNADQSQWLYTVPASGAAGYNTKNLYDYFLIRGFAIVMSCGIGTYGSQGFELCGSDLERDSHKAVVEWLTGKRKAFSDQENNIEIKADWCNKKVAMTGTSYGGTLPYEAATTGVDGLKTIIPFAGIANWYSYSNSQGAALSADPHYADTLSAMNAGAAFKDDAWLVPKLEYVSWLRQQRSDQEKANGNYDENWAALDYSRAYEKINCSALIFNGLNDFNVMTTQANLMYQAFRKAGKTVKVILHQDGHNNFFGKLLGDELSDELINRWLCHYLYDVDNGIEEMAEITVQSNLDASLSFRDEWNDLQLTPCKPAGESGEHLIHSQKLDEAVAAYLKGDYDEAEYLHSLSEEEAAVYTIPLSDGSLISGIPEVHVRLKSSDTDQDNLMVTAVLMDEMADGSSFEAYLTDPDFSSRVPLKTIGTYEFGNGHEAGKIKEFVKSYTFRKIFAMGWIDLLDPEAEKNPALNTKWHTAKKDEYSDYAIVLTPSEYTLEQGHVLKLYLFAQDPLRSREDDSKPGYISTAKQDAIYSFTIDNDSLEVLLPLRK